MAGHRKQLWYRRFPSDFLAGTRGMRPLLFKTYARLLDGIYEWGGPLPNDAAWLAHLLELRRQDVGRLLDELAGLGKIEIAGGLIHNGRADYELAREGGWKPTNASGGASPTAEVGPHHAPTAASVESHSGEKTNENYVRTRDRPHVHTRPYLEAEADKQEKKGPQSGLKKAHGERLPDDYMPDLAVAIVEGMSEPQARRSAASFTDYWRGVPGAKGRKVDWPATWRNWVRRDRDAQHRPNGNGRAREPTMLDEALAELKLTMTEALEDDGQRTLFGPARKPD